MSSRCRNIQCSSSDYNQPNNKNLSKSLKSRAQHSINKINQKAFIARDSFINCCDDRIMEAIKNNKIGSSSSNNIRWQNVLVFSVVVLINIASISCVAARQIEGESEKKNVGINYILELRIKRRDFAPRIQFFMIIKVDFMQGIYFLKKPFFFVNFRKPTSLRESFLWPNLKSTPNMR